MVEQKAVALERLEPATADEPCSQTNAEDLFHTKCAQIAAADLLEALRTVDVLDTEPNGIGMRGEMHGSTSNNPS